MAHKVGVFGLTALLNSACPTVQIPTTACATISDCFRGEECCGSVCVAYGTCQSADASFSGIDASWQVESAIDGDLGAGNSVNPRVAIVDGSVAVAWIWSSGATWRAYRRMGNESGWTESPLVMGEFSGGVLNRVEIAAKPNGTLFLGEYSNDGGLTAELWALIFKQGTQQAVTSLLSPAAAKDSAGVVALNGDSYLMAYRDTMAPTSEVATRLYSDGGWRTSTPLNGPDLFALALATAGDGAGNAVAAWAGCDGGTLTSCHVRYAWYANEQWAQVRTATTALLDSVASVRVAAANGRAVIAWSSKQSQATGLGRHRAQCDLLGCASRVQMSDDEPRTGNTAPIEVFVTPDGGGLVTWSAAEAGMVRADFTDDSASWIAGADIQATGLSPAILASGLGLVAYSSQSLIRAQMLFPSQNPNTGVVQGISTAISGGGQNPRIAVSGDRAFVVWDRGGKIWGAWFR